jgi:hypothetical protein
LPKRPSSTFVVSIWRRASTCRGAHGPSAIASTGQTEPMTTSHPAVQLGYSAGRRSCQSIVRDDRSLARESRERPESRRPSSRRSSTTDRLTCTTSASTTWRTAANVDASQESR